MNTKEITSIDEYISAFPEDIQVRMQKIRSIIRQIAPEVTESMAYQMPAFKLNKRPLAYFAGYKTYIGFYPTPSGMDEFNEALAEYKQGKGSAHFPHNKPLPLALITKIVQFRKEENELKRQ